MDMLYSEAHHGYEPVLGFRAVGDVIITGVINASKTIPMVRLEVLLKEGGQRSINHLDCDTVHVLVGTDHDHEVVGLDLQDQSEGCDDRLTEHVWHTLNLCSVHRVVWQLWGAGGPAPTLAWGPQHVGGADQRSWQPASRQEK